MKQGHWSNIFSRIKVEKQLYIIFFSVMFLPVIVIGTYLVFNSRSLLEQHYKEQCYSDNLRVKSLLIDLTSTVYHKAMSLASDKELIQLLTSDYDTPLEGTQAMESYDGFRTLLSQDISFEKINVYTFNETLPDGKYIHPITDEIMSTDWYAHATSFITPFWMQSIEFDDFGNEQLVLSLHTRIFLPQLRSYALLKLTLSNNHIKNRIENSSLHTVLWLNDQGVFYSSNRNRINHPLTSVISNVPGQSYLGPLFLDDQKLIGSVSSISTTYSDDLFYVASINMDGYEYINQITRVYLAILLLILCGTSVFIHMFSRYFSGRVITLRESMHSASQGQYEITDSFQGTDEISEAFADLNVMIQNILRKEASVYESQIRTQELINKQQQMEFRMLSSQINPHFLYNTLETIRMRALKAGNKDVATAIKLLGKSMRYVLETSTTSLTTLSRELDYIETYLSIQRLRFYDRVNYSLKMDDSFDSSQYKILPLLLQPVMENALLHGLEEVEENGQIIIHIHTKRNCLYIDIFDNGCGMTLEEMTQMNQNIYHHPEDSSSSIGLYNVNQRIQLCYGVAYGLKIQSKKGRGTVITLILPLEN